MFRLIDERARKLGLDSLGHRDLLQVYGSANQELRVSELAERLDIAPASASNLIKNLVKRKYLQLVSDESDMRVTILQITSGGRNLCEEIDARVRPHVYYCTGQLTAEEREAAISMLMLYVGPGLPRPVK